MKNFNKISANLLNVFVVLYGAIAIPNNIAFNTVPVQGYAVNTYPVSQNTNTVPVQYVPVQQVQPAQLQAPTYPAVPVQAYANPYEINNQAAQDNDANFYQQFYHQ